MDAKRIVVLEGDETGQELLEQSLRVLAPDVIGLELELARFDLSLESRRATRNAVVYDAAAALQEAGLGLKAATITPEGADDVGSPNRILREEIDGTVIVRTGRRIPGVVPLGGVHAPISVVRMAVGGAYGAKEWREGEGDEEAAFRTERIERSVCRAVAEFGFQLAERTGAKVFGLILGNPARRFRWLCGTTPEKIGVRVPVLPPESQAVLDRVGALAATSANLAGGPEPRRLAEVPQELLARCAALDGGELPGTPSTVIDFTGPEPVVIREGAGDVSKALQAA